jgi:hypothetical protein
MTIETAVCTALPAFALTAVLSDTYRAALIRVGASGSYGPQTRAYADLGVDEVQGAGYTKGGQVLKGARVQEIDGRACLGFDDVQWPGADILADGVLVYSETRDGAAVGVLSFGGTYAAVGGDTFVLPLQHFPFRL